MLKEIVIAFPVENKIEEISKLKTKEMMKVPIYKQILRLEEYNMNTEKYFQTIFIKKV